MQLTRFEPWSFVDLLQRDLDRLSQSRYDKPDTDGAVANWTPAVDIAEQTDRFVLHADVPGVDPADIEITMDNGVLTLAGERRSESAAEEDGFRRVERATGRFFRRFTLPDTADADNITAKSHNGILEISIPKLPEVRSRRITVEAA
jgi:HSP20 family protein